MSVDRSKLWMVGVALLISATAQAQAVGNCSPAQAAATATVASRAIDLWISQKSIMVTDSGKRKLVSGFCRGVGNVAAQFGLEPAEVARNSSSAIITMLDSMGRGQASRSLEALIASAYSLNSRPAPPEPLPLGRIHITYARQADEIIVGKSRMAAYSLLLADFGETSVIGTLRGRQVCNVPSVRVRPMETTEVQC